MSRRATFAAFSFSDESTASTSYSVVLSKIAVRHVANHATCTLCGRPTEAKQDEIQRRLCTTTSCHTNIYHLDCALQFEDRVRECSVCAGRLQLVEVCLSPVEKKEQPVDGPANGKPSIDKTSQPSKKHNFWRWIKTRRKKEKKEKPTEPTVLQEKVEVDSIGTPSDLSWSEEETPDGRTVRRPTTIQL